MNELIDSSVVSHLKRNEFDWCIKTAKFNSRMSSGDPFWGESLYSGLILSGPNSDLDTMQRTIKYHKTNGPWKSCSWRRQMMTNPSIIFVCSIFNSLHFILVFEDGPDASILRWNSFEYCSHDWIIECRNKWVSSIKKKFKCQCTSIEPNINSHCIRFVCNLHQYCVLRSTEPRTRLKGMHTFCLFTR